MAAGTWVKLVPRDQSELWNQRDFERSRIVAHHTESDENLPQRHDWHIHPVLPVNGSHTAFVLGTVGEEACRALEPLASNGQLICGVFCTLRTHWRFTFAVPI